MIFYLIILHILHNNRIFHISSPFQATSLNSKELPSPNKFAVESNNMQINSYHFFLRLKHKFAGTQDTDQLLWTLKLLHLHWSWTDLYSIHQKFAWINFIKTTVRFSLGRGFKNKRTEIFTNIHWSFWFLHRTERNEPILVFHEFLCSFRMELLMLNNPILSNSEVLFNFLMKSWFLLLRKLRRPMHNIFIPNLDHVLFIFIDDTKKLPLDPQEVLTCLIFTQKSEFLFQYQF